MEQNSLINVDFVGFTDDGYIIRRTDGSTSWVPASDGAGRDREVITAYLENDLPIASLLKVRTDGLTVHLDAGLYWHGNQAIDVTTSDSYTFTSPISDTSIAIDVIKNEQNTIELQVYEWNPVSEVKADPDPTDTVILADVIRGVLIAGVNNLESLEEE